MNNYRDFVCFESSGDFFIPGFGIRILVAINDPTLLNAELLLRAGHQATKIVQNALMLEHAQRDPNTELTRAKEKAAFQEAFSKAGFPLIYMEQITNEYCVADDVGALRSPWYAVTTPLGHFKVGWRRHVIVLDWSRTTVTAQAPRLFPMDHQRGITMEGQTAHCYGYEKLQEYLQTIRLVSETT